jgi:hypothetical protein
LSGVNELKDGLELIGEGLSDDDDGMSAAKDNFIYTPYTFL